MADFNETLKRSKLLKSVFADGNEFHINKLVSYDDNLVTVS